MGSRPIGIFDSGIGGLTVLGEIKKLLPREDIIYFGDTARVPYGNKSKSTIIKFSTENILFLLEKKVKVVVIACNTSSSLALDYLRQIFNIHILGVVEAGADKALGVSKNCKIGVIGTQATIESKSYEREILKRNNSIKVYSKSCPLFVPLAEEGMVRGRLSEEAVKMYLSGLKQKEIDTLILGCTHYPLLKKEIRRYLKNTFIVDSAKEVAFHTKIVLEKNHLLNKKKTRGKEKFYVTDEPGRFIKLTKLFLKKDIIKLEVVNV